MIPGPNEQIQFCLKETKKHLKNNGKRETNTKGLYTSFGIVVMMACFETSSRTQLWLTVSQNPSCDSGCHDWDVKTEIIKSLE